MNKLTLLEMECQDVLVIILDLMAAGHQKLDHHTHMELTGRIQTCVEHLINKEYGCASGKHASSCTCKEGFEGRSIQKG